MDEKTDEQKIYMINHWGFKDPNQIRFVSTDEANSYQLAVDQELETIPEFKTGNKMFLRPSIYNLWTIKLPKAENRQQDFYFNCPFEKTDTTVFKIPGGYKIDALPEAKTNNCKYASYTTRYWYDEKSSTIYAVAKIILNQYKIPAADYKIIKNFFDAVIIDNQQRVVIKKE